jgi:hypothetical protein
MASKFPLRRLLLIVGLTAVALDLAISACFIRAGALGFRALPPFQGTHHPWQRRWLAEQQVELAGRG